MDTLYDESTAAVNMFVGGGEPLGSTGTRLVTGFRRLELGYSLGAALFNGVEGVVVNVRLIHRIGQFQLHETEIFVRCPLGISKSWAGGLLPVGGGSYSTNTTWKSTFGRLGPPSPDLNTTLWR